MVILIEKSEVHNREKNKEIEKYNQHKKFFGIENDKYLDAFEELLKKSQNFRIECSVKFKDGNIFPCRYVLWYGGRNNVRDINLIFNFLNDLKNLGVDVNFSLLNQILDSDMNFNKISSVVAGFDLRENYFDSRAKIWLKLDNENYFLFNKVLNLHGYNEKVIEVINKNELLFGFDFSFNGKTRIKIYPFFEKHELENEILMKKLKNSFSKEIFDLINDCYAIHFSFQGNDFERIIHFHTLNFTKFSDMLKEKANYNLKEHMKGTEKGFIVSLKEKEIDNNNIETLNLYY